MTTEPIVQITPNAKDKVLRVRAQELDPESLALWVGVTGFGPSGYQHQIRLAPLIEAGDDHVVQHHDDLSVVVPASDVDKLRGATVTIEGDPAYGAVVVSNPNRPTSPTMRGEAADLTGDVAQRVAQVLDTVVNPSIAAHGGQAELVAVEDDTAYLRLSGGCQGCGLAKVTLSQGIEVAIRDAVPEVRNIVDVTDHEAGDSPYFEAAKK
ncbi:MAG TPA: NifU family protein [Nitriliruptorales bacterium]|nr:NifU family protein [Nitriliruptorales bacterium]